MKRSTIGALLLLVLGAATVVGLWFLRPKLFERSQLKTSDAKAASTIRICGDNYFGYWFMTSPEMRKQGARQGQAIDFTDDGGAYAERLQKFASKEYDMIVLPVNSYLLHGAKHKYPGVIIAAIAESKGADGIVGFGDRFPSGKVSDLNDATLHGIYTAESPSSFMIDLTIADFDLFNLQQSNAWRVEVNGSKEAFKLAKRDSGDFFALWEPDLSNALEQIPGLKSIWGSDKFAGYIVDVFVVRRDYLEKHEADVLKFFQSYFMVMRLYANNQEQLLDEMSKSTGLKRDRVKTILPKIDWYDLQENCELQFGLPGASGQPGRDGVINTIIACTDVYLRTGKLASDPLEGNPYLITNRSILEKLQKTLPAVVAREQRGGAVIFTRLGESDWSNLKEVGTMRVEPITYQSWNNMLTSEGKDLVDKFAAMVLNNYPAYRVAIRGHTPPGGDEAENVKIALERAQTVTQRLIAVNGIDANRLHAEGWGSRQLPPKKPGESVRAYNYRLSRVEFVLLENGSL